MIPKQVKARVQKLHKKLGRRPTTPECLKGGVTDWAIRKAGGLNSLFKAAGIPEDPSDLDLRLELIKQRKEQKVLEARLKEAEESAASAKSLRSLIHGVRLGDGAIPSWVKSKKEVKGSLGIPVLLLSDIHFDEVVKPEQIGYVNSFNREVAETRIKYTFQSTVDLLKNRMKNPKYDGFVCALGGDLLSGNIHEELAETNEAPINLSIMALTDLLISGLSLLADEFGKVFVPCVVGNHGRHHRKPRMKNKVHENYEWLIYEYLRRHFKDDSRFTFLIPDGPDAQFSIYDFNILLTHGDQFRGGSGISGLFSPLMIGLHRKQKKHQAIRKPFDLMMMGHWHTYVHTSSLVINGSIKGYDEYANQNNFDFENPQQALFIVHPERGVNMRWPVQCEPPKKK